MGTLILLFATACNPGQVDLAQCAVIVAQGEAVATAICSERGGELKTIPGGILLGNGGIRADVRGCFIREAEPKAEPQAEPQSLKRGV